MTFRFRINFTIDDIVPQITLISHVKFKYFLLMHKKLKQFRNNSVILPRTQKYILPNEKLLLQENCNNIPLQCNIFRVYFRTKYLDIVMNYEKLISTFLCRK